MSITIRNTQSANVSIHTARRGEQGIALVLCIGFLAILSILGAVVLNMTNTDLNQTWRDQVAKDVFYTADRAVEYALSPNVYSNLVNVGDEVDMTDPAYEGDIIGSATNLVSGLVTYEGFGGAPSNAGKYDKKASSGKVYRYFHISVETESTNPRVTDRAFIDGQLVQAFPTVTNVPVEYVSGNVEAPDSGGN